MNNKGEDMERLTEIKTHVTGFSYTDKKEGIFAQNVYAKLAAYKDTGLTPEQIEAQQQEIEQLEKLKLMLEPEVLIKALRETDSYIEKIYLNGGCYQFFKFIKTVYPMAEPYITQDKQHIVTKIGSTYYDITGKVIGKFQPLSKEDVAMCKKWSFSRRHWLYRECPNCGEYVAGT